MKIILVVHQFPPNYTAGTEVLTFSVGKDLIRRGHEVRVLTASPTKKPLSDAERFDEYEIQGMMVYRFSHGFVSMGNQSVIMELEHNNILLARYFRSILDDYQPEIVHIFHMSRLGAAIIDVATSIKIPTFFTPTDFWSICPTSLLMLNDGRTCMGPTSIGGNCVRHVAIQAPWGKIGKLAKYTPNLVADGIVQMSRRNWISSKIKMLQEVRAVSDRAEYLVSRLNALNGIISPTNLMTQVLIRNGVNATLIRQHMYGIDIDKYDPVDRKQSSGRLVTFGFIGGLSPHKGCHILIKAIKYLNRRDIRLKIYGNPKEMPKYYDELLAMANEQSTIEFCGTFPNDNISSVLSGLDALVVPSIWFENAPLVIHSALAARCPVLASNFPGMSEVITNEKNGLLFEPGSPEDLAAKISRILDEPGLLQNLSSQCRLPKSIPQYVEEILAIYKSPPVIQSRGGIVNYENHPPMDPKSEASFITGWCVVGGGQPAVVELYAGDQLVVQTCQFQLRPDVSLGLKKAGLPIQGNLFGFSLSFTTGVERSSVSIRICSEIGHSVSLPIGLLEYGSMVTVEEGCYIGLESEYFG